MGWRAGIAAAALPAAVGCGFFPSSSRISAPSPRPRAFLAIGDHLLSQVRVALGPFALLVVNDNGLAETRRFRQANVARNDALEYLSAKKSAQVAGNLARKRGAVVVHRKQDALDFQVRVQGASDSHESIQQLRDAFQGQVFALNRNQHRTGGYERVQ